MISYNQMYRECTQYFDREYSPNRDRLSFNAVGSYEVVYCRNGTFNFGPPKFDIDKNSDYGDNTL